MSGSHRLRIAAPSPLPTLLSPAVIFRAYLHVFFLSPSAFGSSFSTTWDMKQKTVSTRERMPPDRKSANSTPYVNPPNSIASFSPHLFPFACSASSTLVAALPGATSRDKNIWFGPTSKKLLSLCKISLCQSV